VGNVTASRDSVVNVTIAGTYKDGFVDPIKGKEDDREGRGEGREGVK